jgi:hypothetical protein
MKGLGETLLYTHKHRKKTLKIWKRKPLKEEGLIDLPISRVLTHGDKRASGCEVGWRLGILIHFGTSCLSVGIMKYTRGKMGFIASLGLFSVKI